MGLAVATFAMVVGFTVAVLASRVAVTGAGHLVARTSLPPFVVGITLVALGTDLPEIANSIIASLEGLGDVNVGDSIGSVVTQMTLVLGLMPLLGGARPALPPWATAVGVGIVLALVLGAVLATSPALLFRLQEPLWRSVIPFGIWALVVTFLFSRRVGADPVGALRMLRIGAAGLLLLLVLAAPPILARRESGRRLFIPTMGREVLAWGAWRTVWVAGYFYNDGRVREVTDAAEILEAVDEGPTLVLVGPSERRRLETMRSLETLVLARGPRDNVLLRVARRAAPGQETPSPDVEGVRLGGV